MRGIEGQHHVHRAARRGHVRGKAHVVLDVAVLAGKRPGLAGKLRVQLLRRLAQHVHQHVDASPVGHADDDFLQALGPGLLYQVVEHRDQAVAALQREALLTHVARVQVTLEALGGDQFLQDGPLDRIRRTPGQFCRFHPVAQPQALAGPRHVRHLHADVAAVDLLQLLDDFTQRQPAARGAAEPSCIEHRIQVRLAQAGVFQLGRLAAQVRIQLQRIDARGAIAPQPVKLYEPHDRPLARGAGAHRGRRLSVALKRRSPAVRKAGRQRTSGLDALEQIAPVRGHFFGIVPPGGVQLEHIRRVARKKRGLAVGAFDTAGHGTGIV